MDQIGIWAGLVILFIYDAVAAAITNRVNDWDLLIERCQIFVVRRHLKTGDLQKQRRQIVGRNVVQRRLRNIVVGPDQERRVVTGLLLFFGELIERFAVELFVERIFPQKPDGHQT